MPKKQEDVGITAEQEAKKVPKEEPKIDQALERIKGMSYGYGEKQIVKEFNNGKHIAIAFFDIRDQPIAAQYLTRDSARALGMYLVELTNPK